jgi:hypothetical protein
MEVVRRTLTPLLAAVLTGLLLVAAPRGATADDVSPGAHAQAAPGVAAPAQSSETTVPQTEPEITLAGDRDLSECIGAVERPGCDTGNKGGILYAVMGALVAGLVFIGWRVVRSIRQREKAMDTPTGEPLTRSGH